MNDTKRTLSIRLQCASLPPLDDVEGPILLGLQDKAQNVHAGRALKDGATAFECEIVVKGSPSSDAPDFSGPFVHGPRDGRFLYLSWKRPEHSATLWLWRVKIPLSAVDWKLLDGCDRLQADISGRKPHASAAIGWQRVTNAI
jgi:hypothetical protein